MDGCANAAQAERWNGAGGRHWIAHRERHLAGHQRLVWRLFAAAAISPGDRVLDVGCGCGETTIAAARAAAARVTAARWGWTCPARCWASRGGLRLRRAS